MFDKLIFDRNAFDRSVSSNTISIPITSKGSINIRLVVQTQLPLKMAGNGSMKCDIVMRQNIGTAFSGSSIVSDVPMRLNMSLNPLKFSGSGKLIPNISVHTPIKGSLSGSGTMKVDNRMNLSQYMKVNFTGDGTLKNDIVLQRSIIPNFSGSSSLKGSISLPLLIPIKLSGTSELTLRRLSARNENFIELLNINLLSGETVTIDTDLLQVLFGAREDVSAVSTNSVFFELNPGENEITVSTNTNESLEVVGIWQNRWL